MIHLSSCCKAKIKSVSAPGGNFFSICSQCDQECDLIPEEQSPDDVDCGNKDYRVRCRQPFCKSCKAKDSKDIHDTPIVEESNIVHNMLRTSDLKKDEGHTELVADVFDLLFEIKRFEFHDYRNKKYAAPKVELVKKFEELEKNVKDGKYDNQ